MNKLINLTNFETERNEKTTFVKNNPDDNDYVLVTHKKRKNRILKNRIINMKM